MQTQMNPSTVVRRTHNDRQHMTLNDIHCAIYVLQLQMVIIIRI